MPFNGYPVFLCSPCGFVSEDWPLLS